MATMPSSESRRRYSWWWDSHISPKNSRWLQDNLTDMDMKVKAMIKLIEEDADSFARRAEMYYKKRPELMKLVEEFYRAYRALAERYDHATGALRQAHRTMTEAFPNQIPLMSPDESHYASSNSDMEPHTPEVQPPVRAFFGPEDLPKDTSGLSSDFHAISRNGAYSEDNNALPSKRGLKQLNEMFSSGEMRVKKGLNFLEEDGEFDNKTRKGSRDLQKVRDKQDINVMKDLQQDVSRLATENENLKTKAMEESNRANKAESEVQSLRDRLSELNSQKDEVILQYQRSLERISSLESQLSDAQNDMQKLNSDILSESYKLANIEELNRSLCLELEMLEKKAKIQGHELKLKQNEFNEVTVTLQEKNQQFMEAQKKLLAESQEEVKLLNLEIQKGMEKLRDIQLSKENLHEEICKLKEENNVLKEENYNSSTMIKDHQQEIILLKDKHKKLTEEIEFHTREKEILDQEFCHLKKIRDELERRHQDVLKKMEIITLNSESLQVTIKELQTGNLELKENSKKQEAEKELLMEKLKDMGNLSERNRILEDSLSELNMELEVQKEKNLALNGSLESLNHEFSACISERDTFASQSEILTQNLKILSDKNKFVENALADMKLEVRELEGKVDYYEKSCQSLNDENCIQREKISALNHSYESLNLELSTCISERDSLVSQVGNLTHDVENLSEKNNLLDNELTHANNQVDQMKAKLTDFEASYQYLQDQNCAQRDKIAALNASHESLNLELSTRIFERDSLASQLEILTQNRENLSEKNKFLEIELSNANVEGQELKAKLKDLEETCQALKNQDLIHRERIAVLDDLKESLHRELSTCITERDSITIQLKILTQDMENMSEKNILLESTLSDAKSEIAELKVKLKDLEESCNSLKDQNCTQNEKIASLTVSHESLNLELSTCIVEKDSFVSQLAILSEKENFLENALSDSKSEVQELKEKIKDLEGYCQSLKDQNCRQSEKITSLNDSLESLNLELSTSIAERDSFVSQLEILNQNLGNLSEKNNFLENALADAKSELGELKAKVKDLEESCQTLKDENCTQTLKVASLNDSHESLNLELSTCIKERDSFVSQLEILTQNVGYLSEKKNFLENALADAKSEVGELKAKVKDLEESCQTLKDENCTQTEKVASLNDSHESLNLELSTCNKERDSFVSQLEILTQNVGYLSEKKNFLENALSDATSEVGVLKAKVNDLEESCQTLKDQNCTQNEKIVLLNDSRESLNIELSTCIAERDSLVSQLEILNQNMGYLSEKNNFLENALSDAKSEAGELKEQAKDLEESCQSLKAQNCIQSEKIASLNNSHESLNLELSNCIAEKNAVVCQLDVLTQSVENLSEKNKLLENAISDAKSELGDLRAKLKTSEESCQSLKDQNCIQSENISELNDLRESLNLELSTRIAERDSLFSQVEFLTQTVENLSEKNSILGNAFSGAKSEVEELKEKLKDFEKSCQSLEDQNLNLREKNSLLNDSCESMNFQLSNTIAERDSIVSQVEILTLDVNNLSEKNNFLQNALSDAKIEAGGLRAKLEESEKFYQSLEEQHHIQGEKLTTLNRSYESLNLELSTCITERDSVVSQLEIFMKNVENLSKKNNFFENALCVATFEVEELKAKVKDLEESCQSLEDQNNKLLDENNDLTSQVQSITSNLDDLGAMFAELQYKHSNLSRERDLSINEINELKISLELEKEEHINVNQSYKAQVINLENMISLLQEENHLKHEKLEEEQNISVTKMVETFILQTTLSEAYEINFNLLLKAQKHLEECRKAEALVSQLEQEKCIQMSKLLSLTKHNEKLSHGIHLLSSTLCAEEDLQLRHDIQDDALLDIVIAETRKLLSFISATEFENQQLNLEVSILVTLLRHATLDMVNLRSERCHLEQELGAKAEEIISFENKHAELLDMNAQLMKNYEYNIERQDVMKAEIEALLIRLSNLQEALQTSTVQRRALVEEKASLSVEVCNLKQKHIGFEKEHAEILQEAMKQCHHHLFFKSLNSERLAELKSSNSLNEHLMESVEASKKKKELLKAELDAQFKKMDKALQDSEEKILNLIEEKKTLSDEFCKLKQKHNDSEGRNIEILAETMRLEHLHLYFKNLNAERLTELESYSSLHKLLLENTEANRQREKLLSAELEFLSLQLSSLQESFQASQDENLMLLQERNALLEELHNLKHKHYDLEEKHIDVLSETIKLNHLHLFFKSLSIETLLELKSTNCELASLYSVKSNLDADVVKLNGEIGVMKLENAQLMNSMTCLEELRNSLLNLEFDLSNARSFYDELYIQSESITNELRQKETQLSEANERVKFTDEKNAELLRLLQDVQLQIEESKLVKEELERKNLKLTEVVSQRNGEISCLHEAKEVMQKEIDKINEKVEVLRTREKLLFTELQKQANEVERCELEIDALLSEIQILTVNAAIYEEKAHEVILEGEIRCMVEKHVITMEVSLIKDHVDFANRRLNNLEEQIKGLVAETTSLHVLEVTTDLKSLNCNERVDISLGPHQHHYNDSQPRTDHKRMSIAGVLELEQFISKADALQKMIIDVRTVLKQERCNFNSSLTAARKEAEGVRLQALEEQTDIQERKKFSSKLDEDGVKNEDISKDKFGQIMKDIQLDQASSSSNYIDDGSNGQHVSGNSEIDDQLWEAAERECHNQSKVSEVDAEHDIETVEEEKSEYPSSELLAEKELNIDMLGTLKKHLLSKQEWNKKMAERLDSDAARLSDIKTSVEELERKMESSPIGKLPPNFGYDTIKAQLKEAEANVLELMDANSNLAKNITSSNGSDIRHGERGSTRRRQISEDARKASEKVGRLELELQKIQYILLKLEEEHENKRSKAVHRSRVLLRDFLYGRKDNRSLAKKSCFCGCMRPKTNDDH